MTSKGGRIPSGSSNPSGSRVASGSKFNSGKNEQRISYWELQVESMKRSQLREKAKELGLSPSGNPRTLKNRIKKELKKDQKIGDNAVLSVSDQGSITAAHFEEKDFNVDIIDHDLEAHKDASVERLGEGMYAVNQESGLGGKESLLVTVSDPDPRVKNDNLDHEPELLETETEKSVFKKDLKNEFDIINIQERRGGMVRIPDLYNEMKDDYSKEEFQQNLLELEKERVIELQTASDPKLIPENERKIGIVHESRGHLNYVVWRKSEPSQLSSSSSTLQEELSRNYDVKVEKDRLFLNDKESDQVMAYADLEIQGDNVTTMFLEVKPDYQGRGLGKQLISEIENYSAENGKDGVVAVYVTDSSKDFWKKQGFVELGTDRNEYYKPMKPINKSGLAKEKEKLDTNLTEIDIKMENVTLRERRELAGDRDRILRDIAINEKKSILVVQKESSIDDNISSYSKDLQARHAIAKNIEKSDFTNLKESEGLDQVVEPKFTVDYTKKGEITTTRMGKVKVEEKSFDRVWIVEKDDTAKQIEEAFPDDAVHSLGGNPFTQPKTSHFSKNNRVRTSKDSTIEWRNDRSFGKNFYYPEVKPSQEVIIVTDEDHLGEYINREVSRSIKSDNIEQYSVEGMKSAEFKKLLTDRSLQKDHAHDENKAFAQEFFVEADSSINTTILSNMVSARSFYAQHQADIINDAYEGKFSSYKQSSGLQQNVSFGRIELGIGDHILSKQLEQDTKVQIIMDTEAGVQTIETSIRKAPKGNFNVKFEAEDESEDLKILTTDETIQYLIQNLNLTGTQSEELISRLYRQGYLSYPRTESDRINLNKEQLSAKELSTIWSSYFEVNDGKLLLSTIESGIKELDAKKGKSGIIVLKESPYQEGDIEHRVLTEIAKFNVLATTKAQKITGKFILEDEKTDIVWSDIVTLINTDKYDKNVGKVIDVKLITDQGVSEIELYNFIKKANIGTPSTRTNKIEAMTKAGFLIKQKDRYFVDERMKFFIVENRIRNQAAKKRYAKTPHFDAGLTKSLMDLRSDLEKDPSVKNYSDAYSEVQKWLHAQYDPYDPETEKAILREISSSLQEAKNRTSIDQEVDELVDDVIEVDS